MASDNHHQNGVPVEVFKFDRDADAAVTKDVQPIFNTDGQRVVMPELHQRRIKAQMESHKNPKNRGK